LGVFYKDEVSVRQDLPGLQERKLGYDVAQLLGRLEGGTLLTGELLLKELTLHLSPHGRSVCYRSGHLILPVYHKQAFSHEDFRGVAGLPTCG
jgi:hypothetical protein